MDLALLGRGAGLFAAAAAAGAINAVAGGGTLATFPTLVWIGLGGIEANATSTLGLLSGTAGSVVGYRREIRAARAWIPWLVPSSLIGGAAGALLLLSTPPALFDEIVPFLILGATGLFVLQDRLRPAAAPVARPATRAERWGVAALQLAIALYGGYFGAGIGILMLASLGLLRLGSVHRANGLKTLATIATNGVAAVVFVARGVVAWPAVLVMVLGATLGGYFGADYARRLGERAVRRIVVAIGLGAALATWLRQG
jgi:uncharacterized membrane protein YfcA